MGGHGGNGWSENLLSGSSLYIHPEPTVTVANQTTSNMNEEELKTWLKENLLIRVNNEYDDEKNFQWIKLRVGFKGDEREHYNGTKIQNWFIEEWS